MCECFRSNQIVFLRAQYFKHFIHCCISISFSLPGTILQNSLSKLLQLILNIKYLHIIITAISFKGRSSVINSTVQCNAIAVFLQHRDKRQKIGSLEAVFIQVVRSSITGCNNNYAIVE